MLKIAFLVRTPVVAAEPTILQRLVLRRHQGKTLVLLGTKRKSVLLTKAMTRAKSIWPCTAVAAVVDAIVRPAANVVVVAMLAATTVAVAEEAAVILVAVMVAAVQTAAVATEAVVLEEVA